MKTICEFASVIILTVFPGSILAQWTETGGPQGGAVRVLGGSGTTLLAGTGNGVYSAANPAPEFSVRPGALRWEGVVVGEQVRDTLVVGNTGKILLKVDSIVAPDQQLRVNPADLKVVPGDSTAVVVTFSPDKPGRLTGHLVFYHNGVQSPDSVALSAEAVGKPGFVLQTPVIDFGSLACGQVAWDSLKISNPGSAELRIDSVTSTLTEFSAGSATVVIAAGATGRIAVRFSPGEGGLKEGELRVWHNSGGSPGIVAVMGFAIAPPAFVARPDSIVFTAVEPGQEAVRMATILNAGGSTLRIDSIACGLEGFQVGASSVEINPDDSAAVTIRFAPSRSGVFTGQAYFFHNALSGRSSIELRGEAQGVAFFTLAKTALAFGPILLGQTARDSVLVSNPGTAQLLVDSVTVGGAEFSVHPASSLVAAGASRWFIVQYAPSGGGTHIGQLAFWHDGSGVPSTVDLTGSAVAPPLPPLLASPAPGQPGLPSTVELAWRPCPEATAYRLELSVDPEFLQVLQGDSVGTDTSWIAEPLAYNTTYFWRVSARNVAGWGPPSEPAAFRTASGVMMSTSVPFPAEAPTPSSYRLLGIPGIDVLTAAQLFEGKQKIDWRMYQDNGAALDYLVELPGAFPLPIGEGYWVLKRGAFTIARQLTMPGVGPDGTAAIPLHPGPNIITNPFDRPVAWADVVAANGPALAGDYPLGFEAGAYEEAATLEPFEGYYIRNYQNLSLLKIPYPFLPVQSMGKPPATAGDWTLEISFEGDLNSDRGNILGVANGASSGRDLLDRWKPGPALDLCHLAFARRDLDQRFPYLRADFRPATGEGNMWDLELRNPRRIEGVIRVDGVERVPPELSVVLVDLQQTVPVDLRENPRVALGQGAERLSLRIIVGSPEYAREELARLVPERLALLQNYPNPFNPVTAIPFTLPHQAQVRLEVVSLVGQTVATLVDGPMTAGTHTAHWDGTDERGLQVSSGVYFYRLMADQTVVGTRKLVLLK